MKRLRMSTKEEILRLKGLGLSKRKVSKTLKIDRRTVDKYWEGPSEQINISSPSWTKQLDWQHILSRIDKGHFATTLYDEYKSEYDLPSYDSFNRYLKKYKLLHTPPNIIIKLPKNPGEEVEIDYSGKSLSILHPSTGEIISTELFVACMPYSGYIFAEFTYSQKLEDFVSSHCNLFEYIGGIPLFLIPDNLKSGVTSPHRYDPTINKTYHDMSVHYKVAVSPARVAKPKDKPSVERAVGLIQQFFMIEAKDKTYTSLHELNKDLKDFLYKFNRNKKSNSEFSRWDLFQKEIPNLRPLPETRYELFYWKQVKVHPDCHFQFNYNYYSVPYRHAGKSIEIKHNNKKVMAYYQTELIANHALMQGHGHYQTNPHHYPEKKLAAIQFNIQKAFSDAQKIGENTFFVIKRLSEKGVHPLANLRKIQGIIRLSNKYGPERMEYACDMALEFDKIFYQYINNCAKNYNPNNKDEITKKSPIRDAKLICLQGGINE